MRKNISINISGIIFHIEEDGYDQLKQYLESINRYFSSFEDSKEIISDIESRIAEIFLSKLKDGNQIIKGEDVVALIATMGSVADFEAIEEQAAQPSQEEPKPATPPERVEEAPKTAADKKLYRDNKRKILGGVASGIAHYFGIDPLWIRLILLILFFNIFFNFPISGVILVAYILAWIIVPASDDLEEDQKIKKLYRNPEHRVLGGVGSGIAAYFGADITLIRLLFVLSIFLGGSGLVIYIILWIITPEAKSITEKMQMQGEPVTLSNIETNLKKSLKVDEGEENIFVKILLFPFRLIAVVFTGLGKALGPLLMFLVEAIRVLAGIIISIVGLSMIFALLVAAGIMVGVVNGAHVSWDLPIPFELIRTSVPIAGSIAAFFSALIPALFITLIGVMVIAKQKVLNATVAWSMFAAWIVSVLIFSFTLPAFLYDFKTEGNYQETTNYDLGEKTAILKLRDLGNHEVDLVHLAIRGHSGNEFKLETNITAKGSTREEAIENARMVGYNVKLDDDSVFWFDSNLQFTDKSKYRFQVVNVVLLIPFEKPFIMESNLDEILQSRYYASRTGDDTWIFTESGLECLSCDNGDYSKADDEDNSRRDRSRVFEMGEFNDLDITGNFDVNILPGDQYEVLIGGSERYFDDLRVVNEEGTLVIDGSGDWSMRSRARRLTIDIKAPVIRAISIQGSARAKMRDFELDYLSITMGGKADGLVEGQIEQLEIELESAATLVLQGSGKQLSADLSAAARLEAFDFEVDEAAVGTTGASNAKVNVRDDLAVESSGVSSVIYRGTADVHVDQSGSGTVREDK